MIIGGLVEIAFGVNAEGKPLEEIAAPLSEVDLLAMAAHPERQFGAARTAIR